MTSASSSTPETKSFHLDMRVARAFLAYASGFWRGETGTRAWLLSIGLATFLIAGVGAQAALNWWNRTFFNALGARDVGAVWLAVPTLAAIVAAMAAIGVGIVMTRETLQVRWRAWLVERLVGTWLGSNRFYHMGLDRTEPANPEYRIADDSRWATEPLTDLVIGLIEATVAFAIFVGILWTVGGSYTLTIGGSSTTIPAYMVLAALAYGITASVLMAWIGRPLVGSVGNKNAAEGHFRFALTRTRENAESIALMRGAGAEQAVLKGIFAVAVERWLRIVRQHANITWITNSTGPMTPVVPLLIAAPKYLSGELSLGDVTSLAAAFVQVQMAISWVVNNYNRLAEWYASARRVMDIVEAADGAEAARQSPTGPRVEPAAAGLALDSVALLDDAGKPILATERIEARPGSILHIAGGSSLGKTTLVKAMAGLWPWGSGAIRLASPESVHVVPQKPYLPLGTLADALAYPEPASRFEAAPLAEALAKAGLAHLGARLNEHNARWDQLLSIGERQRLAVARVLLHRPRAVILDDALSALDQAGEREMLALIRQMLPEAIVVTLGQRPALTGLDAREWQIERGAAGARLIAAARVG